MAHGGADVSGWNGEGMDLVSMLGMDKSDVNYSTERFAIDISQSFMVTVINTYAAALVGL